MCITHIFSKLEECRPNYCQQNQWNIQRGHRSGSQKQRNDHILAKICWIFSLLEHIQEMCCGSCGRSISLNKLICFSFYSCLTRWRILMLVDVNYNVNKVVSQSNYDLQRWQTFDFVIMFPFLSLNKWSSFNQSVSLRHLLPIICLTPF